MHNTAKTIAHVVLRANDLIGAAIGVVLGQQKDISKDLESCLKSKYTSMSLDCTATCGGPATDPAICFAWLIKT